jgi:hypothetical protein
MTRYDMLVLISKYELWIITIKEHQFHDRDNKILYSKRESWGITKIYGFKLKYNLLYYKLLYFIENLFVLKPRSASYIGITSRHVM